MLNAELLALLVCPETHQDVALATALEIAQLNEAIRKGCVKTAAGVAVDQPVEGALVRADRSIAYPIRDGIPVMLVAEGLVCLGRVLFSAPITKSMSSDLKGKKLGVLLTTDPAHANFRPAVALMTAALDAGIRLYLYCIDDGVKAVGTPEIQSIKARGASVFGCAYGAHRRHIAVDDAAAWSGLTVLADVVGSTDKFVSF